MNTSARLFRVIVLLLLAVSLSSCRLPSQVTPSPVAPSGTNPVDSPRTLPTPTLIVIPQETNTATLPTATTNPTAIPTTVPSTATPRPPAPTNTPVPVIIQIGDYAVVLVAADDSLQVHQAAGASSPVIDSYVYNARDIELTGKDTTIDNVRWVEAQLSSGGTGWVNARFLTELVPVNTFCSDPQVQTLLNNLETTLANQDGQAFAGLISPVHGLTIQYLRGGTLANYNFSEASWVFNSTFVVNWGIHPGSGLAVKGNFSNEVLPNLLDVFDADYQRNCSEVVTGGASYSATWPDTYTNINFIAAHRPGEPGDELNWRTWLVGVEYVDGEPYLFALNHLFWEP